MQQLRRSRKANCCFCLSLQAGMIIVCIIDTLYVLVLLPIILLTIISIIEDGGEAMPIFYMVTTGLNVGLLYWKLIYAGRYF